MPNAAANSIYIPESVSVAQSLRAQLIDAHRHLLAEVANMESLTSAAELDAVRCISGRWKISQASLARRALATRICDYLLVRSDPPQAEALIAWRQEDRSLVRRSAGHVAAWSNAAIAADWAGYCAASRLIRGDLHDQIARDQRVLDPLLERAAKRG